MSSSSSEEEDTTSDGSSVESYVPSADDIARLVGVCGVTESKAREALVRTHGSIRDAAAQLMGPGDSADNPTPATSEREASETGDPLLDDPRVVSLSTVFRIPRSSAKVALQMSKFRVHVAETLILKQVECTQKTLRRRSRRPPLACCASGVGVRPEPIAPPQPEPSASVTDSAPVSSSGVADEDDDDDDDDDDEETDEDDEDEDESDEEEDEDEEEEEDED